MEVHQSRSAVAEVHLCDQGSLSHRSNALTLHVSSGRMASILRKAVRNGFKKGRQHDCHEALTYILSLAHEEETKLLQMLRQGSESDVDNKNMEYDGVVARSFRMEEHVTLTVSIRCYMVHDVYLWFIAFVFSNIFGSAPIALTCARSSTSGSSSLFP
jgi:hypothetical protein